MTLYIKVPPGNAENIRRFLLENNLLNTDFKVEREGTVSYTHLTLPTN